MIFTLIVCTYCRPQPILDLLDSVRMQSVYPQQILIIDGSSDHETQEILKKNHFDNLEYFKVGIADRGLTRQRNFGISKVNEQTEIVCFLDDDTILSKNYFEQILKTYTLFPNALGVGGYITNEIQWKKTEKNYIPTKSEFFYDDFVRKDGSRFVLRKKLGLDSNVAPGCAPDYSHGRSIGFLPPSGKIYKTDQLMGGVSSFRKTVFDHFKFSTFFEGYGLYEDADFTLRVSKKGSLFVNTAAQLEHYHHPSGRPNQYQYGKMVVRNGWYVWRIKTPKPSFKAQLKWHAITLLLTSVRISNIFTTNKREEAFTESLGRLSA